VWLGHVEEGPLIKTNLINHITLIIVNDEIWISLIEKERNGTQHHTVVNCWLLNIGTCIPYFLPSGFLI